MVKINVSKSIVSVQETEPLYSGSEQVHTCHFAFDTSWNSFSKSAVFRVGGKAITAVVDENGCCVLPWELLARANIGLGIEVGVYGVSAQAEVLTSVWDSIGTVRDGTELGSDAREPSAGVYEQVMASIKRVDGKVEDYTGEMKSLVQRSESATALAVSSAEEAAKSENAAESAAAAAQDAIKVVQTALDNIVLSEEALEQAVTAAAESAGEAKRSENAAAGSAAEAEDAANRAQAEADRVGIPAAVGVYNVILTDRVTAERYALIVESGRLSLLGVSGELDGADMTLVDNATGAAYRVAAESGRIILEEV